MSGIFRLFLLCAPVPQSNRSKNVGDELALIDKDYKLSAAQAAEISGMDKINPADILPNGCILSDKQVAQVLAHYNRAGNRAKIERSNLRFYYSRLLSGKPHLPYSVQYLDEGPAIAIHYRNPRRDSTLYSAHQIDTTTLGVTPSAGGGGVFCHGQFSTLRAVQYVPVEKCKGNLQVNKAVPMQWLANKVIILPKNDIKCQAMLERIENEAKLTANFLYSFKRIDSQTQVRLLTDRARGKANLLMPFLGVDLLELHPARHKFTLSQEMDIFLQVLSQIKIIHQAGYVHRDIKLENILVKFGEQGKLIVTIVDFGLSEHRNKIKKGVSAGSPGYIPSYYFNLSSRLQFLNNLGTDLHAAAVAMLRRRSWGQDNKTYICPENPNKQGNAIIFELKGPPKDPEENKFYDFLKQFILTSPCERSTEGAIADLDLRINELHRLKADHDSRSTPKCGVHLGAGTSI